MSMKNVAFQRVFLMLFLLCIVSPLFADRIFILPTAYTLRHGELRMEFLTFGEETEKSLAFVQMGILPFIELQVLREEFPGKKPSATANFLYSLSQPIPDYFPGVAVGILDILNETESERSFFVAFTWQSVVYSDWAETESSTFTVGIGTGRLKDGIFISTSLPMHRGITFFGEYDTKIMTAGFDIIAFRNTAVRIAFRDGHPLFGFQFVKTL